MGGRGASSFSARSAAREGLLDSRIDFITRRVEAIDAEASSFEDFVQRYGDSEYPGATNVPAGKARQLRAEGLNTTAFQAYLDDTDDYALPTVLSDSEFDDYVADNGLKRRVLYRGNANTKNLSAREMHRRYMEDPKYWAGEGVYGHGIYFGNHYTATDYTQDFNRGTGKDGAIIRAVLKPDARAISYDKALEGASKATGGRIPDNSSVSVWARSQGYDVITQKHPSGDTYHNVLNRGSLVISASMEDVRSKDGK